MPTVRKCLRHLHAAHCAHHQAQLTSIYLPVVFALLSSASAVAAADPSQLLEELLPCASPSSLLYTLDKAMARSATAGAKLLDTVIAVTEEAVEENLHYARHLAGLTNA